MKKLLIVGLLVTVTGSAFGIATNHPMYTRLFNKFYSECVQAGGFSKEVDEYCKCNAKELLNRVSQKDISQDDVTPEIMAKVKAAMKACGVDVDDI